MRAADASRVSRPVIVCIRVGSAHFSLFSCFQHNFNAISLTRNSIKPTKLLKNRFILDVCSHIIPLRRNRKITELAILGVAEIEIFRDFFPISGIFTSVIRGLSIVGYSSQPSPERPENENYFFHPVEKF